jgi:hypothetical protein
MNLDHPLVLIVCPVVAALIVIGVTLYHHKRLDKTHGGAVFSALTAGFAIPKGAFLCWYIFDPDPLTIPTKLRGYEKEIFVAGALVIFLAIVSIWSLCEQPSTQQTPGEGPKA